MNNGEHRSTHQGRPVRRRILETVLVIAGVLLLVVGPALLGYIWLSERHHQATRPAAPPAETLPARLELPTDEPRWAQPNRGPSPPAAPSPTPSRSP